MQQRVELTVAGGGDVHLEPRSKGVTQGRLALVQGIFGF